ncbi:sugar ABC transporter permease [Gryllotalpicola daejeonensis]|uniref:Maltose/maltodextrin transport system permease protein n=1 Tax=Gryllotalpicola daejeonensis TaxID=993087 RepID=A0ABP7ZMM5_9MICO
MTQTVVAERADTPRGDTRPSPRGAADTGLIAAFRYGDLLTRGSAVVMGLGNLARRQYAKGAMFLIVEIGFLVLFVTKGLGQLAGLGNLGPVTKGGQHWDADGNFVNVNPTNSVARLLYGIAWVFVVAAFLLLWSTAVRSAYRAQVLAETTGRAPSLRDDARELGDERAHQSLLALPVVGIVVFTILPLVFMISMAFTTFDKNHPVAFNWAGLSNFVTVLSPSGSAAAGVDLGLFLRVLAWTLVWAVLATFLNFFLGMGIAMLILRRGTRLKNMWRALFSMSIAVPQFVSLLVINQMLQDQGIVNQMLKSWGLIDHSLPFFTDAWWARGTVVLVNLWIGIPFTIMQITGVLQNVPGELYEAARLDGANWWQLYRNVTLPYVFFVLTPYLIVTFTANINNFNVIYLLSNGAPTRVGDSAGQTDLLITWLYKLTVDQGNYNVGAVIGIMTFIVLGVTALITYRNTGSYKNEEELQ